VSDSATSLGRSVCTGLEKNEGLAPHPCAIVLPTGQSLMLRWGYQCWSKGGGRSVTSLFLRPGGGRGGRGGKDSTQRAYGLSLFFVSANLQEQIKDRLDGIGLDTANKEFLAIKFKRTQDMRSNYAEEATKVAQKQYSSLLEGLRAVGQVKGWQTQQIVFVGGTCGSVHVESFNKNMKALGVLESKWNPIRQKLVRRLLET
jgi:hypothetical protein